MSIALAFLRRDALIWRTYRLAAIWQALGVFILIGLFYFVGTSFIDDAGGAATTGGYVAFALSGVAFSDVILQGMYAIPQSVRDNQKSGTLETMLMTPIMALHLAVASGLFAIALALCRLAIYLGVGVLALGYWREANVVTVLLVAAPAVLVFVALGVLSTAFVILVKQGDPVLIAYGALNALLSGLFFPVQSLPEWAQTLALLMPLTYALNGVRAGLAGAPPGAALDSILILLAMLALLTPIGLGAFALAVTRARKEGSLVQY
jgi:ABC-2 type transport system permease protein